jgi:hypothetical protein
MTEVVTAFVLQEVLGMQIITNTWLTKRVQVKFPRSKKKRIRKKWAKCSKNFKEVPDMSYFITGRTIIMHPVALEKLKRCVRKQGTDTGAGKAYG